MKNKLAKVEPQGMLNKDQMQAMTSVKNAGDAVYTVAQEYALVIEEVLMRQFGFTEKDLKKMHQEIEHIITVVKEAEGAGLNAVGIRTIRMLSDIAQYRQQRNNLESEGIKIPQPNLNEIKKKLLI